MSDPYANQNMVDSLVERIRAQRASDNLDLSLCNITKVPLKVINNHYNRQCQLDLSYNHIRFISPKFTLGMLHLTRLDLSSNQLRNLPDNFGELQELVYLDLHKNMLEMLPLSMGKMKRLMFLRISRNPLRPPLMHFIGPSEAGISAVALAGLVVQLLDDLDKFHSREGPEPVESIPCSQGRSSRVHYQGRSAYSSTSSIASGGDGEHRGGDGDMPKVTHSSKASKIFKVVVALALWIFMVPIAVAYVADSSFLEFMAQEYPWFGSIWHFYEPFHKMAAPIAAWIPKYPNFTLIGPTKMVQQSWTFYGMMVSTKDAFSNACSTVWLNIINR